MPSIVSFLTRVDALRWSDRKDRGTHFAQFEWECPITEGKICIISPTIFVLCQCAIGRRACCCQCASICCEGLSALTRCYFKTLFLTWCLRSITTACLMLLEIRTKKTWSISSSCIVHSMRQTAYCCNRSTRSRAPCPRCGRRISKRQGWPSCRRGECNGEEGEMVLSEGVGNTSRFNLFSFSRCSLDRTAGHGLVVRPFFNTCVLVRMCLTIDLISLSKVRNYGMSIITIQTVNEQPLVRPSLGHWVSKEWDILSLRQLDRQEHLFRTICIVVIRHSFRLSKDPSK